MSKLNSDKKFYITLITVVFFGVCCLGLLGWFLLDQRQNQPTAPSESVSRPTAQSETSQDANNAALYKKCIDDSNRLFDEYMAKAPADLSIEEYNLYRQTMTDTRDNQKEDCDRTYNN